MRIEIAERLKPFSHQAGLAFVLPESTLRFTFWPARIAVDDLSTSELRRIFDFNLAIQGPLKDFTVVQDLEKGNLQVWGHALDGYVRYHIAANEKGFEFFVEKAPKGELTLNSKTVKVGQAQQFPVASVYSYKKVPIERLSLGSHKKQDWNGIYSRFDLAEILPIWFRLGQLIPQKISTAKGGTASLFEPLQKSIKNREVLHIAEAFRNLFLAGFDIGLSPHLFDNKHHGFILPDVEEDSSPLYLLKQGADLIRALFFQQSSKTIEILPAVPPEFHCGRMCGVQCADLGRLDFEWSKKMIRRMIFIPQSSAEIHFTFQKEIKRFRLRTCNGNKGRIVKSNETIPVEPNQILYFDCFEK